MQKDLITSVRALGMTIFVLMISGCGSTNLETASVQGKVTINGKPLATGRVFFIPEKGRMAQGKIQPDGSYTLTTYTEGDGAIIGKHRVTIRARPDRQGKNFENESPVESLIPEVYADEVKSDLSAEVKPGEDNQANFDLHSH